MAKAGWPDVLTWLLRRLDIRTRRPGLRQTTLKTLRETPRQASEAAIRRLCASVRMADGMTLCRVLGRYKLFVDDADFGLSPHLLLDGFWEMWVTEAILATACAGMHVVDIGANLGYYTVLLGDVVGPSGRVHAFEPNPRIMTLLERSVALNGFADRIILHAQPLAARSGEPVRLVVPTGEPKNAHLAHGTAGLTPAGSVAHDLCSAALDDIIGDARIDFIKIDAEGAERDIWEGMQRLVARGRPLTIFMEFAADRYAAPDNFLAEFAACGFKLSRIDLRHGIVAASVRDVLRVSSHTDQMLALVRD